MNKSVISKVMSQLAKNGWVKRKQDKEKMKFYTEVLPHLGAAKRRGFFKERDIDPKEYRRKYKSIKTAERYIHKKNLGGSYTVEEWDSLKKKYGNRCAICRKKEPAIRLTADHIIPVSKWNAEIHGEECNSISNIQPLCQGCNSRKGNRLDYPQRMREPLKNKGF